jgi:hypothetical protein
MLVILPIYTKPYETGIATLITLMGIPVYLVNFGCKNKPAFYTKSKGISAIRTCTPT